MEEYDYEDERGGPPPTELSGEDTLTIFETDYPPYNPSFDIPLEDRKLTFEEASKCLNKLGKDASGSRYAYLMLTATDRKLTDVSIILNFKHLMFLDLSGNFLTLDALQVLCKIPFLIYLKADRNRVESGALDVVPFLQILSLNLNRIEETGNIEQPILETLNLEYNQISIAHFESERLPKLRQLDLKGNNLTDLTGTYPKNLEMLFVAKNKITKLDQLATSTLKNLTILHLRDNKIRKLNGFTGDFEKLEYLNIRNNRINKLRQFWKLKCLKNLKTLIILGNPVTGRTEIDSEMPGEDQPARRLYDPIRIGILVLLPDLVRINKENVTLVEREEAKLISNMKLIQIMDEDSSEEETEFTTTVSDYDDLLGPEDNVIKEIRADGFDATHNSLVDEDDEINEEEGEEG